MSALVRSIALRNFKGFSAEVRIDLRPITLLFGANSAGKSSVLQALQYVREILERQNVNADRTLQGGEAVDQGCFLMKAWNDGKGILGVHVHNLKNSDGKTSTKGANPFDHVTLNSNGAKLSTVVKTYDPPGASSTDVYAHIKANLESWIEAAIASRNKK